MTERTQLLTVVDTPERLELRAPRLGLAIVAGGLLAVAAGIALALPAHRLASLVLVALAVAVAVGLLRVRELVLDHRRRTWRWRSGWLPRPTERKGTYDDLGELTIDPAPLDPASPTVSRLRSRVLTLRFADGRSYRLGFPMGPRAAEGESARYAESLGVRVVDRTGDDLTNPTSPAPP